MARRSLRAQLLLIGLAAAVVPLVVLVVVVFGVEEDVTIDETGAGVETISDSGVSPWVPIAALVLAVVAVGVVRLWARRAVDPIEQMTSLTDAIQAGSLDQRLDLDDAPVEIRELGESFDRMLDRLEAASDLERQRIEDASHDLRTPLAALAARLEVAGCRTDLAEMADDVARCEADVQRLQTTLDELLASARLRRHSVGQVDTDLVAIVQRVVAAQHVLSPQVEVEVVAPPVSMLGVDGSSVERAVANLVTNAVEHGGGAPVSIVVRESEAAVDIVVTDTGPGIDPARLDVIFDRYAGDDHGLGLALVKQVADVYGSVSVESPIGDDGGTRFTLSLRR